MNSTTRILRLYGASIAIVSGVYSLLSATTGSSMMGSTSGVLMVVLGVVVVVHGVILLTPSANRLGSASGPLMIGYSVLMLLNQALVGVTGSSDWGMGSGMDGSMGGGMNGGMGSGLTAGMAWDLGMVALAVLMLLSGVIMSQQPPRDSEM